MPNRFHRNVALKGIALFIVFNLLFAVAPHAGLGQISLYNRLFPGRLRLPFGEDSARSYNLSLLDLDAMFASHVIAAAPKPADEFRVLTMGDSSIWGTLLRPEETLAGQLNAAQLSACGRAVRVYNLGYPTISLTKDRLILDRALTYQPDLIVWGITLEAFPRDKQLSTPLVANTIAQPGFFDRTIVGQRRPLADLLRLQLYGVLWAATGIDQTYPKDYPPAQTDLTAEESFHGLKPPTLTESTLAFDVLDAALQSAAKTPVLIVNEPMLVSDGKNSDVRYNFFYPRWAYDQYRQQMSRRAQTAQWTYLDAWNIVPASEFTNSAIHLTPQGEAILAARVGHIIAQQSCSK